MKAKKNKLCKWAIHTRIHAQQMSVGCQGRLCIIRRRIRIITIIIIRIRYSVRNIRSLVCGWVSVNNSFSSPVINYTPSSYDILMSATWMVVTDRQKERDLIICQCIKLFGVKRKVKKVSVEGKVDVRGAVLLSGWYNFNVILIVWQTCFSQLQ